MKTLNPYLRYISRTSTLLNKRYTIAYDCRLLYVMSGSGKINIDGKEMLLSRDNLLYFPSGIEYLIVSEPDDPMQFITVNFDFNYGNGPKEVLSPVFTENYDPELLLPSFKEVEEPRFFAPFLIDKAGNLLSCFLKMTEVFKEGGKYSEELCSALLKSVILEILYGENRSLPNNKIVVDVITYIKVNFKEPLTNVSIASALSYHPYYIGALFRTYLGKTPRQYLDEVRLNHAEELLAITNESVYEISYACGYQTAEHFTRRFKLRYGITPTEWRKRHRLI